MFLIRSSGLSDSRWQTVYRSNKICALDNAHLDRFADPSVATLIDLIDG